MPTSDAVTDSPYYGVCLLIRVIKPTRCTNYSNLFLIIIILIIFIYCIWVVTRWQWLFYMYTEYEIGYY